MIQKYFSTSMICFALCILCMAIVNHPTKYPINNTLALNKEYNSESPFKIFKDWFILLKSKNQIEISSRIVQFTQGGNKRIQLQVVNQLGTKDIILNVLVINVLNKKSFAKKFTVNKSINQLNNPSSEYKKEKLDTLEINLPKDYNPEQISVLASF